MVNGFARSLFAFSAAALFCAGNLPAQDSGDAFKQGVKFLQMNEDQKALDKFREALNADPSNEEAYKLWKETEQRVWSYMLAKGGDYERIARHFLKRATVARKARSADKDTIEALVLDALGEDTTKRREANFKLAANHGEYAVPALLEALGDADDTSKQVHAIVTCEALGRNATLPLIAVLSSTNKTLRMNAAIALQYIGDSRALPALKRIAESADADAGIREVASKAIKKMGGANVPSSLELFLRDSRGYLTGAAALVREGDMSEVLWDFRDGALVARKVPAPLFHLELAKDAAYRALAVDPNSEAALVSLSRAYLAEQTVVEETLARNPEDEEMAGVKDSLQDLGITVLAAGPKVVRQAVSASMRDGMFTTAVSGMKTLAQLEDPQNLEGSPLIDGLKSVDKRVRYAAALALSDMGAKLGADQRADVVASLSSASLEQAVKVVRYLDPNKSRRKIAAEASSSKTGTVVEASANTSKFLGDLRLFPNVDVVVVNEKLDKWTVWDVIHFVKDTEKLAKTKIIVVAADKAKAEETYGDKIDAVIQGPLTSEGLSARVEEVLKGMELSGHEARANATAVAAANAMARLDPKVFNVAAASAKLNRAAGMRAAVAIPALKALGNSAGLDSCASVGQVIQKSKGEAKVVSAACRALGAIMARAGKTDDAAVKLLIGLASDKGNDSQVRSAAVSALGRAPLLPGERAKLFRDLRVNASAAGDTDSE